MSKIRIGLDFRLFGIHDRGIGRYANELALAIKPLQSEYEFIAFVHPRTKQSIYLQSIGYKVAEAPFAPYSLAEQIYFPKIIKEERLNFMLFPHFNAPLFCPVPYSVTVHDLILHHFPSRMASTKNRIIYWLKYFVYRLLFRLILERAQYIVAVSRFTSEDLLTYYPHLKKRVTIILESIPELTKFGANDRNLFLSYNIQRPFVLCVGAFYPHKNISRTIRCWAKIKPKQSLVFVGKLDYYGQRAQKEAIALGINNISGGVFFLGDVDDSGLSTLYSEAEYVLVPSLWEGVGLPGLEALRLHKKLISSAESGLPEACGQTAVYIPVKTDIFMVKALENILSDNFQWPSIPNIDNLSPSDHNKIKNEFNNNIFSKIII